MNLVLVLTVLLLCVVVPGQASFGLNLERLQNAELNSEQQKAVDDYIRQHERPTGDLKVVADRRRITVRSSEALRTLFPHYRFVAVPWLYEAAPEAVHKYSIPWTLTYTLVLDENGRNCMPRRTGAREEYADLLRAERVKLTDEVAAALVTAAYTDISGVGMSSTNLRHRSSDWFLGYSEWPFRAISSYEEVREASYYLISTDSSGFVISGNLVNDVLERRKIK
jgi:hypothetical protein